MSDPRPARSGCALVLGVVLVGAGALFLAQNLFGFSLARFWERGIFLLGTYWPAILIVWGVYKLYQRIVHPESARVGAGEVLLLVFFVCVGLLVGLTGRLIERLPAEVSLDDIIESIDTDISFGPGYSFSEEHRFELVEDRGLHVANDHGAVSVQGWDEPTVKVVVTKRVYRPSEDAAKKIADGIRLDLTVPPTGPARLAPRPPSDDAGPFETDLEIWMPRRAPLTLANQKGPLRVADLQAPVGVATNVDSIEVSDIEGRVIVDGRRGPVRVQRIRGDVEARNRYGSLTVQDVQGDLVGETANGSIVAERISGSTRLINRRSRIRAARIDGDLTIEASHSEVLVEGVGATATVETSYRPVFIRDVGGQLAIEARNSEIEVRDVKGNVDVSNVYRPVKAVGIGGSAVVRAKRGGVELDDVAGPIRIENSDYPVDVRRFQSSLTVESEHAPLRIATDSLGGELRLSTSYSNVDLFLPRESSFRLEATVKEGNVESDFRGSGWEETREGELRRLRGTAGSGASPIQIQTSYGDIKVLEKSSP